MLCGIGSMDPEEGVAAAALLQLSQGIYEESLPVLAWGKTRKRDACKPIATDGDREMEINVVKRQKMRKSSSTPCAGEVTEEKQSPKTPLSWSSDKSGERSDSPTRSVPATESIVSPLKVSKASAVSVPPVQRFWETQGPPESKRTREAGAKRVQNKMKVAELQEKYITFSTENARLREELDRYRQMHESLHAYNVFLKTECPKTKNARLTEVDDDHAVNAKAKEDLKGKEKIEEEKFVLPDLNVPLEDPFYVRQCFEAPAKSDLVNTTATTPTAATTPPQECTSTVIPKTAAAEARKQRMEHMRLKSATTLAKQRSR